MKYSKKYVYQVAQWYLRDSNENYLKDHPKYEKFKFPQYYYFRYVPSRLTIHWAIIKEYENITKVYFINDRGRAFDELEFKSKKIAQRQLRKNGFYFSTNRYCPFRPIEPIFVKLSVGKKTAPYSKGNLWKSIPRTPHYDKKIKEAVFKKYIEHYERTIQLQMIEEHCEQLIEELQNCQSLSAMKSNVIRTCIKNYQKTYPINTQGYNSQTSRKKIKSKPKNKLEFLPLIILILIALCIFLYEYIRINTL